MTPAMGYTQMKESGLTWVGKIPSHWELIANKYVMHKEKRICEHWEGQNVLSLTISGVIVRDLDNPTGKMPATFDGYQHIYVGELLMCLFDIDVTPRCVGRVFHDGVTSPAYSSFKLHENADLGYFYYYYLMMDHTKELLHLAKNLRHSFTEEQLGQLKVPLPPLDEQRAIAAYLDTQCAKIDEIIAEAKASIEDYKQWKASVIYEAVTKGLDPDVEMKESGVEWIGKIPASWMLKKLRNIGAPQNGISKGAEFFGAGYPFVSYGDVYKNFSLPATPSGLINSTEIERDHYSVKEGDVFFTRTSETIEEVGFSCVCEKTIPDATFAGFLIRVRPYTDELLTGFAKYYFRSPHHRAYFAKEMNLVTRASLSQDLLKSMPIVVPPQNEQKEIADFLERKCSTVDALISEKQSLIADLESYKKSLIYEAVTGKRRVPTQSETTVVAIHPVYQKALLMCRVLDLLGDDARGRIHVQKCIFAIECLLKMPFQTQYARYQHGPYDACITDYEALIGENEWFTVQSGSPVTYKKGAHFDAYLAEYMKVFAELDSKIKEIVEYLKPMKTAQAERVATLLAAWNDFILDGTADPTDQQIINEVITNWTPNKANTQVSTWQTTLNKLKQRGFAPSGFGIHTIQKEVQEV